MITGGAAGASFDEVAHRLTEELAAAGLSIVCAATTAAAAGAGGAASSSSLSLPPVPPGGDPAGRAALLVACRCTPGDRNRPPVAASVVCHVFEAIDAGDGGPAVVVQAAAPRCGETNAALRTALDRLFRLPKTASPPGTYAWPPVHLPPQGGEAKEAAAKAKAQMARQEGGARK